MPTRDRVVIGNLRETLYFSFLGLYRALHRSNLDRRIGWSRESTEWSLPSFDALSAAPILSYRVRRPSEDRTEGKTVKRKRNGEKKRERINISSLRQLSIGTIDTFS